MATQLEQAKGVLKEAGIEPSDVRINRNYGNLSSTALVLLKNGRQLSVDIKDGWEETLATQAKKFNNKKPINTKEGDKA